MRLSFRLFVTIVALLCAILTLSLPASPLAVAYPHCEMSDSAAIAATDLSGFLHPFGSIGYPHEFSLAANFPVFDSVFELYLSDTVSDRWSSGDFNTFIGSILDNDSTLTDDIFGKVWYYFTREDADSNEYHRGVRFTLFGSGTIYNRVVIQLYAREDIPGYPTSCNSTLYGDACKGYSFKDGQKIVINASPENSMEDVLGLGVAHELAHICWGANGLWYDAGYYSANETMSTLAEYFVDSWRPGDLDVPYDASFMRQEHCDQDSKYEVEKTWITYLHEVTKGNPFDPTDDLIYRWINSGAAAVSRMKLSELAVQLWDNDFDWIGGDSAQNRLKSLFQNFLAAKFCNAPDFAANSRFGVEGLSSYVDFHLFQDNDDFYAPDATPMSPVDCPGALGYSGDHLGSWNVRIIPPSWELTDDHEDVLTPVAGIYEDKDDTPSLSDGDGSTDYIDVAMYGTDYVVFRSGDYYDDDAEHEFRLRLGGMPSHKNPPYPTTSQIEPIGWIMGYSCDSDTLQVHPECLVFVEPLVFTPTTTISDSVVTREICVTDFGRSIKSVVLAVSCTSSYLSNATFPRNFFVYAYSYGVNTPAASTRTWQGDIYVLGDVEVVSGGVLGIDAGTHVKVWPSDLAAVGSDTNRVELNVDGELQVNGTSGSPVTIEPWTQTTSEDWAGVYFSAGSDGGTFSHCTIGYAESVIDSYAPISIDHSTIRGASDALISMTGSFLTIDNSDISLSNGDCIRLNGTAATIDSTVVEDYFAYGVYGVGNAALNITYCEFNGDSIAVYVEGNSTNGIIANSTFQDNHTGISYFQSSEPDIDECTITGNNVGIKCDYYSAVVIEHCMTSASYSGNLTNNGAAIFCLDNSSPAIGHCNISGNGTGVGAFDDSEPQLNGYGSNTIMSSSVYHVVNLNSSVPINAMENYWYQNTGAPDYYPKPTKIMGDVIYENALTGAPNPTSPWEGQDPQETPKWFVTALGRAHPNPFNPTVQVPFTLRSPTHVRINVYDVAGRLVKTLVNEGRQTGEHIVTWDGRNDSGAPVATAVYFVRMVAGSYSESQKIVMLK